MTYYPYQQPTYYAPDPMETLLRPARRAGILMFVVSGLMLLCGVCVGMLGALPLEQMEMPPEVMAELSRAERETGMKRWVFFAIGGGVIAVPSLILLILGFFVRRGGAGSIITSIVLTGLLMLFMAINLLSAARSSSLELILPLAVLLLLVLLFVWLIQALRNAGQVRDARLGQQFQYWQAMQYQRQYAQPPAGQWQPPQAPPPPPQA